jgi:hypothetical protein
MKRDEQQVNDLIDHIRNKMTDPFDVALHPALLINISTGMHASKDVQDSLLNSKTIRVSASSCVLDKSLQSVIPLSAIIFTVSGF